MAERAVEQPAPAHVEESLAAARPRLVLSAGGVAQAGSAAAAGLDEEFALDRDVTVIGSSAQADLRLDDDTVASEHAEIRRLAEGRYEFVRREGAGVALVNGQEQTQVELADSHRIEIGASTLVYRNGLGPVAGTGPGTP
ncbi:MAG: FHA domain-containing protein [Actinomycetota bacterium]|nr:FHA domain-containing protein [Actinomycetota bacterium]